MLDLIIRHGKICRTGIRVPGDAAVRAAGGRAVDGNAPRAAVRIAPPGSEAAPSGLEDIAVRDGIIVEVAPRVDGAARREIDAGGLWILPGLIDPHVHLGLPSRGAVTSDTIESGTRAALFGGVTTVIDFSLRVPGESLSQAVVRRLVEFRGRAWCDYAIHANMTGLEADDPADLPAELDRIAALGCRSLKIFTTYARQGMRIPPGRLSDLLREAGRRGLLVLVHAEDDAMVEAATSRLIAEGRAHGPGGVAAYGESRPAEAEAAAIRSVIAAAHGESGPAHGESGPAHEESGPARGGARPEREAPGPVDVAPRLYFVHVSSAAGLAAVEDGRRAGGGPIHAETCPHYLYLTEDAFARPDGHRFLVTPPLRTRADVEALRAAVRRGRVDVMATDHCPFWTRDTRHPDRPFTELPSGLPGIETRLPLVWKMLAENAGTDEGAASDAAERLVELLATGPARIFGLYPRKGAVQAGADADLVLFDPEERWSIRASELHSQCDHSPFEGIEARGRVRMVVRRGAVVLEAGEVAGVERGGRGGRVV